MVGIGWRQPHYGELLETRPPLGFIEVHSENFFADGGAALSVLEQGRALYDVSLHGVGLSLGSAAGLDPWHLDKLAALVERIEPARVSDHASFARVALPGAVVHANDLLPIAFDDASLAVMVEHVQRVQERLGRQILVENLSAYVAWDDDRQGALAEPEFFNELTRRCGCGLLLDVNNLVVNAKNRGADAERAAEQAIAWVLALRRGSVGEIHLAGHAELPGIVIDDHGSRVSAEVWRTYAAALEHLGGAVPSLIEWDMRLPTFDVLLGEARQAALVQSRTPAQLRAEVRA